MSATDGPRAWDCEGPAMSAIGSPEDGMVDSLICQLWQARAWDRGGSKMSANGRLKARMVRFC